MLTKKVEEILIAQVLKEGYSSNLYLAMASWAENEGFSGIAEWLYAQTEEERLHMLKLIHYINERGGKAVIPAFEQPPISWTNIKDMFIEVQKHEYFISASINEVVAMCIAEKDFTTQHWIQWYVNEQIEEEKNIQSILDKLKIAGEQNLYIFDRDIMSMRAAASAANAAPTA